MFIGRDEGDRLPRRDITAGDIELLTAQSGTQLRRRVATIQVVYQLVQIADHRVIIDIGHIGNVLLSRIIFIISTNWVLPG